MRNQLTIQIPIGAPTYESLRIALDSDRPGYSTSYHTLPDTNNTYLDQYRRLPIHTSSTLANINSIQRNMTRTMMHKKITQLLEFFFDCMLACHQITIGVQEKELITTQLRFLLANLEDVPIQPKNSDEKPNIKKAIQAYESKCNSDLEALINIFSDIMKTQLHHEVLITDSSVLLVINFLSEQHVERLLAVPTITLVEQKELLSALAAIEPLNTQIQTIVHKLFPEFVTLYKQAAAAQLQTILGDGLTVDATADVTSLTQLCIQQLQTTGNSFFSLKAEELRRQYTDVSDKSSDLIAIPNLIAFSDQWPAELEQPVLTAIMNTIKNSYCNPITGIKSDNLCLQILSRVDRSVKNKNLYIHPASLPRFTQCMDSAKTKSRYQFTDQTFLPCLHLMRETSIAAMPNSTQHILSELGPVDSRGRTGSPHSHHRQRTSSRDSAHYRTATSAAATIFPSYRPSTIPKSTSAKIFDMLTEATAEQGGLKRSSQPGRRTTHHGFATNTSAQANGFRSSSSASSLRTSQPDIQTAAHGGTTNANLQAREHSSSASLLQSRIAQLSVRSADHSDGDEPLTPTSGRSQLSLKPGSK